MTDPETIDGPEFDLSDLDAFREQAGPWLPAGNVVRALRRMAATVRAGHPDGSPFTADELAELIEGATEQVHRTVIAVIAASDPESEEDHR